MKSTKKIHVLVAEDDFLVCEEIIRELKKSGYEHIDLATNGKKAVELTALLQPDVVLMDIQMPKMDGLKAAQKIQKNCPTPVVILTAHESLDLIEKASYMGVGAYITKPPKKIEIERAVIIAIARHKDMMELKRLNDKLKKELTNRKKAEDKLKNLVREKEVLLKEIHHRVKNNFMIISSLLNLQSNQTNNTKIKDILQESYHRVNSMALIHERLYQAPDLAKIDFRKYIENLIKDLFHTYRMNSEKIQLKMNIENISLDINKAIPCGLIVNELVSNSLKHGFPVSHKKNGQIEVSMRTLGKNIELIVKDNGIGFPAGFDYKESNSLGLRLVTILAEGQLTGKLNVENKEGTFVKINIPLKK
ncbi:response regulator [candidate division KSB1 bacterium]|nr:response regulator [candidate division KSB1 bacterium]